MNHNSPPFFVLNMVKCLHELIIIIIIINL